MIYEISIWAMCLVIGLTALGAAIVWKETDDVKEGLISYALIILLIIFARYL